MIQSISFSRIRVYRTLEGELLRILCKRSRWLATVQSIAINIVMNETRSLSNDVVNLEIEKIGIGRYSHAAECSTTLSWTNLQAISRH